MTRSLGLALLLALALGAPAWAQDRAPEYATRQPAKAGQAPGMKATELNPRTRVFQITFSRGDEVGQGLSEFAAKNHVSNASFDALGAFDHAVIGWSDPDKRAFKVIHLDEEMEITSFVGNITIGRDGAPVVHAHCTVALLRNGQVYAGHLIEGKISLTMQMRLEDNEPLVAAQAPAN
jgi:predicted DNA-binding protein with PD1-like motif